MIRAYLDSCMVIDLVEGEDFQQRALIKRMGGKLIFTSELVRLEARIKALRENHEGYLKTYDGFFNQAHIIPFSRAVFERAIQLRVDYGIKTPDALHLAAALESGCDEFWTNDLRLAKAAAGSIRVVDWDTLSG